jgi:ribonuclease R
MGDKVRIKVISANLTKRQLDYEWVITSSLKEEPGVARKRPVKSRKQRGKG